jgi:hypothetical protein
MKLSTTINGKTYKIPYSYADITLKEFKRIQTFIEANSEIIEQIKDKEKEQPSEEVLINFYVKFINVVTDIPINTLMQVRVDSVDDETGIEDIFKSLTFLFFMPTENKEPLKSIGRYYFIDNSGIMKDNTLIEYTEANMISKILSGVQQGKYEYLNVFMALFYRPRQWKGIRRVIEPYDLEKKRYKPEPKSLIIQAWILYSMLCFFLCNRKKDYLKSMVEYSAEVVEKVRKG